MNNELPFKVKCVRSGDEHLTDGSYYTVLRCEDGCYEIKNDVGETYWYSTARFEIDDSGNATKVTQKEFDRLPLFLSEQADHEIDFNDNDTVNGIVYICIGSEDVWVGLDFKADVTKSYTAGELWKDVWGVHCIDTPTVEIDVGDIITISYNDSNVNNIDYTTRIDDINKLISDFIYAQELTVESKYNAYNTYNV